MLATASGAVVVEAAGNGGVNLDDPADSVAVELMSRPDSGAIMVGAGAPTASRNACEDSPVQTELTALPFTNYGSRVDIQAHGRCVASLGTQLAGTDGPHNELTPTETNPNKMYTGNFNGTSSASPIVVGAVAALQGVAKQQLGSFLTPAQVLDILERTGTPQPASCQAGGGPQGQPAPLFLLRSRTASPGASSASPVNRQDPPRSDRGRARAGEDCQDRREPGRPWWGRGLKIKRRRVDTGAIHPASHIGVPTGARNTGTWRSDGGPERRYKSYTETPGP